MRTSSADSRQTAVSPYESGPLRDVTGAAIRPGGLALTGRAVGMSGIPLGSRILDVGCGTGASVEYLADLGFVADGIDASAALVAEGLARNPLLRLSQARAEALSCADASRDCVVCECVLSILDDPRAVLAEFRRVVRPDGWLILSDMYDRTPGSGARESQGAQTRDTIDAWLSESGFATVLWEDHRELLREMAARLILSGGSLEAFSCESGTRARPGYYLLVARSTDVGGVNHG